MSERRTQRAVGYTWGLVVDKVDQRAKNLKKDFTRI